MKKCFCFVLILSMLFSLIFTLPSAVAVNRFQPSQEQLSTNDNIKLEPESRDPQEPSNLSADNDSAEHLTLGVPMDLTGVESPATTEDMQKEPSNLPISEENGNLQKNEENVAFSEASAADSSEDIMLLTEAYVPPKDTIRNSGPCGDSITWYETYDGKLMFVGNGPMYDYSQSTIFYQTSKTFTTVIFDDEITHIGENALSWSKSMKSVKLPSSLISIGSSAFLQCTSLKVDALPEGLNTVGANAFYSCDELDFMTLPNSLKNIGSGAFGGSTLALTSLPEGMTSIVDYMFQMSTFKNGLYSLPNSIQFIGAHAFESSKGVYISALPEGVKTIGDEAFRLCNSLTELTFPETLEYIGDGAFTTSGITKVDWPISTAYDIVIGVDAFNGCINLREAVLPTCSILIKDRAFSGASLEKINFPDGITSIGDYAFEFCEMTELILPDSVTYIGAYAFKDCHDITTARLPANLTTIEPYTFQRCGFTSITLPSNLVSIGENAFHNCANLTSLVLPNSVTSIGKYAFHACHALKEIQVEFSQQPDNTIVTDKKIGDWAFYNCFELEKCSLPNGIETIGQYSFVNCIKLNLKNLPSSLTSLALADSAFDGLENIKFLTLHERLNNIAGTAFAGTKNLSLNILYNEDLILADDYTFVQATNVKVYVPVDLYDAYINNPLWASYGNVTVYAMNPHLLTTQSEHGTVTNSGSFERLTEDYLAGEVVTVSATPDDGYEFTGWAGEGIAFVNPSATETTFVMPAKDTIISANFAKPKINITGVQAFSRLEVDFNTIESELRLPNTVSVSLGEAETHSMQVVWAPVVPYDPQGVGVVQTFIGTILLEEGFANPENYTALMEVMVKPLVLLEITSVVPANEIEAPVGTPWQEILLPSSVTAYFIDRDGVEKATEVDVDWSNTYNPNISGKQTITGALANLDTLLLANPQNIKAQITITLIENYTIVPKIEAGLHQVVGLSDTGKVYVTGDASYYEDEIIDYNPMDISGWENETVVNIWAKGENTVALTSDGRVLACGIVASCGDNRSKIAGWSNVKEVFVGYTVIAARTESGTMLAVAMDDDDSQRIKSYVLGWGSADQITIGESHAVAIKDGQYWSTASSVLGDTRTDISDLRNIEKLYSDIRITACIGDAIDPGDGSLLNEKVLYVTGTYSNQSRININMSFPIDNNLNHAELTGVSKVASGEKMLAALMDDGTVMLVNLDKNADVTIRNVMNAKEWTGVVDVATGQGWSNYIVGLFEDGSIECLEQRPGADGFNFDGWQLIK